MLSAAQPRVLCAGPHVLCSLASCTLDGPSIAWCDCIKTNGTHVVSLAEIRNASVQAATASRCTQATPCATNEAPVCTAMASSGAVFGDEEVLPNMVSTFSWEGWCQATVGSPAVCSASPWAACMTAPCTDAPDGGARCKCTWENSSWLDFSSSDGRECTHVKSSVPGSFSMRVMPGAEYVLGACESVW